MHVGDWKFGEKVRIEDHLDRIIKHPNRLVSTDVQILLRECYEQAYGIYDHKAAQNDHFALVRHHDSEDAITFSRLRERLEAFFDNKAGTMLNMSFTEFINQPSYLCDLQLEILSKREPDNHEEMQRLLKEFSSSKEEK